MSRDLTTAAGNALASDTVRPILLFEGHFAGGVVRLWTGHGVLTWAGQSWQGAGTLIGMGDVEETTEVVSSGLAVSLSGVPADMVSLVISESRQGLPGRVWLGFLDDAGAVIVDPALLFAGRLDVPEIRDGEDTCVVTISYENRLVDLLTPREWRYTHESQQVLHPGDLGFEYVTAIQEIEITWGR